VAGAAYSRPRTNSLLAGLPRASRSATAGNSAIGNPNTIAFRSTRNTVWSVRLPRRNRNPSLIASQLTSFSSSLGGDGRIRAICAITMRNVTASNTKAPAGANVARSALAATGPAIEPNVPKPASSAFTDGSRPGSTSRAGHVSSAGRLNV
jgi:hypothetical protein